MYCTIVLALSFSVAIASPFWGGSDDWGTEFSSQNYAADSQTLPGVDSVHFNDDTQYFNDLSNYQVGSGDSIFGSADETLTPENLGGWTDYDPMIEAFGQGLESTNQYQLAQQVPDPTPDDHPPPPPPTIDDSIPTAEYPCLMHSTYCCDKVQYTPLLRISNRDCWACMTRPSNYNAFSYFSSATNEFHRSGIQRS